MLHALAAHVVAVLLPAHATEQLLAHTPQFVTDEVVLISQPVEYNPSQLPHPALHDPTAHAPPLHEGVPLLTVQTVHATPQAVGSVSDRHAPAQAWNPALHVNPQATPSHVAVEFAGGVHGAHAAPQVLVLELSAHAAPHWW